MTTKKKPPAIEQNGSIQVMAGLLDSHGSRHVSLRIEVDSKMVEVAFSADEARMYGRHLSEAANLCDEVDS